MDVLTRERPKPSLPFAGTYQLIDFALSNLTHSGIADVWLSVQFQGATLGDQVANGRPWDLDRTHGGFRLLPPQQGTGGVDEQGFAQGNADELFLARDEIRALDPDLVVVMSADHVYRFDLNDALGTHRRTGAECTVVTSEVTLVEAADHATVEHDQDGRVTGFAYKPAQPTVGTVATEIFIYQPDVLISVLEELHHEWAADPDPTDNGLGDFGDALVPRFVERGRTFVHAMEGYWRDVGEPAKYLAAHHDVLVSDQGVFGDPRWPILTSYPQRLPARVRQGGTVEDSLLSPGAIVHGRVEHSVLGPGVVVHRDAVVRHSVLFADCVVEAGAQVNWCIIDAGAVAAAGRILGSPDADALRDSDAVTIVGRDSRVSEHLATGARLEPGTT